MKQIFALLTAAIAASLIGAAATAQESYRIRPGDTLRIEVLEDTSLNQDALVRPDGNISVPYAGNVTAGGRTVDQVRAAITSQLAPNFAAEPNVFVTVNAIAATRARVARTIDVYVLGEASTPGKYEVARGTTMLQFFAEMGGFSRFAATNRLILRRTSRSGSETSHRIDYDAIVEGRSSGASTRLADGDVIIIPQRRLFE